MISRQPLIDYSNSLGATFSTSFVVSFSDSSIHVQPSSIVLLSILKSGKWELQITSNSVFTGTTNLNSVYDFYLEDADLGFSFSLDVFRFLTGSQINREHTINLTTNRDTKLFVGKSATVLNDFFRSNICIIASKIG